MKADQKRDSYDDPFPARLRKLMKDGDVTQLMLAEAIGVKRQTISAYSDGSADPTLPKLAAMADYFKTSIDNLVGRHECTTLDNEMIHQRLGLTDRAIEKLHKSCCAGLSLPEGAYSAIISALIETEEGKEVLDSITRYVIADFSKAQGFDIKNQNDMGSSFSHVHFRAGQATGFGNSGFFTSTEKLSVVFISDITDMLKDFRRAIQSMECFAPYRLQDQPYPDPSVGFIQAGKMLEAILSNEIVPSTVGEEGEHVNPEDSE